MACSVSSPHSAGRAGALPEALRRPPGDTCGRGGPCESRSQCQRCTYGEGPRGRPTGPWLSGLPLAPRLVRCFFASHSPKCRLRRKKCLLNPIQRLFSTRAASQSYNGPPTPVIPILASRCNVASDPLEDCGRRPGARRAETWGEVGNCRLCEPTPPHNAPSCGGGGEGRSMPDNRRSATRWGQKVGAECTTAVLESQLWRIRGGK